MWGTRLLFNIRYPGGTSQHLVINTGNFSFLESQSSTGPAPVSNWIGNNYWNGNNWDLGKSNAAILAGNYRLCVPQ